jgi:ectoine utilization protein EutC
MTQMLVLTEPDLRSIVRLDGSAVACVEDAFAALATKPVVMPPILRLDLVEHRGEVDVKTAYVPGLDGFAIKVSPGFFDNPKLGLPSLNGLMILFSAKTGLVDALLLDNGYLTDVRTAAAGAVAARHLAPREVHVAGVLGTGVQARLQIQAAHLVRPFTKVLVWGRDAAKATACASDIAKAIGVEAIATEDPAALVRDSQLVVTTTPAREPILKAAWLHPGLHITAMGSDQAGKNEIEPVAIAAADLFVCDRVSQSAKVGELRSVHEAGHLAGIDPPELGQVIAGTKPGRKSDKDVTICDLTGTGAQDTAIATYALAAARKADSGTIIQA